MKNLIKLSMTALISFSLFGCPVMTDPTLSPIGNWENTIKNTDGSSVMTTVEIKETKIKSKNAYEANLKGFTAKIDSKIEGKESDTLKLTNNTITVSGTMYEDSSSLTITDVDSATDSITTNSTFNISKDGKFLTLQPSNIKFKRKDSK